MLDKILLTLLVLVSSVLSSHYRGGSMTWKPQSPQIPNQNPVPILLTQVDAWRRSSYYCDATTVASGGLIGNGGSVVCISTNCHGVGTVASANVPCTDFSVASDTSSGQSITLINIPNNIQVEVAFQGSAWINTLGVGAGGSWSVPTEITTIPRADGNYNTAPTSAMVPVKLLANGYTWTWSIPVADTDGDTVRCRWAQSGPPDECGSICHGLPGATVDSSACTMTYTASAVGYWVVALMIEDYEFTWQTTPLSGTALQFIVEVYTNTGSCTTLPYYYGTRLSGACVGVDIGTTVTDIAEFSVGCAGLTLSDVQMTTPNGMSSTALVQSGTNPMLYTMTITWTPTATQFGTNLVCYTPTDSSGQQGNTACVTYLVGISAPELIASTYVNGTMSPLGTILATQNVWRIQCTKAVNRPNIDAYIRFYLNSTGTQVYSINARTDTTNVVYDNFTLIFYTSTTWTLGAYYYILFDSGVVSGTQYCGPESAPILDITFWTFNIFNTALYGNVTGLTTTSTTQNIPNVTSIGVSTTTANAAVTTVGITVPATTTPYTGTGTASTQSTTSTTTTTTTTTTTASTTTVMLATMTDAQVIDANALASICQQSVLMGSLLTCGGAGAIHVVLFYMGMKSMTKKFLQ